jgi:serine/threonine protein kinase
VVLYQLLTWRRPFAADGDLELLNRIIEGKPAPPRRYAPWLDEDLEACVLRALAVDPAARHQEARDLAAELRAHLRRAAVVRDANDVRDFMKEVFADAAEPTCGRARGAMHAPAPSESDLSLLRDLPGAVTEPVSEAEIIIEEVDAEHFEPASSSAPSLAHGSKEPPSLYDVAPRQFAGRAPIPPGDIFAPHRRASSAEDFFTVTHPPRRRDRRSPDESGPAFVPARRDASTESWPWPASLKKKD